MSATRHLAIFFFQKPGFWHVLAFSSEWLHSFSPTTFPPYRKSFRILRSEGCPYASGIPQMSLYLVKACIASWNLFVGYWHPEKHFLSLVRPFNLASTRSAETSTCEYCQLCSTNHLLICPNFPFWHYARSTSRWDASFSHHRFTLP